LKKEIEDTGRHTFYVHKLAKLILWKCLIIQAKCTPNHNSNDILHRNRKNPKIHKEGKMHPNNQSNP
jgi:hypothetical protein